MRYLISKIIVASILLLAIYDPAISLVSNKAPVTIVFDKNSKYNNSSISTLTQRISKAIKADGYDPDLKIVKSDITHFARLPSQNQNSTSTHNTAQSTSYSKQAALDFLKPLNKKSKLLILVSNFDDDNENLIPPRTSTEKTKIKCLLINTNPLLAAPNSWIEGIKIYENPTRNGSIPISVSVGSTYNTISRLNIYANTRLVHAQIINLKRDKISVFHYALKPTSDTDTALKATIESKGDTISDDNAFNIIISNTDKTRILYVSSSATPKHYKPRMKNTNNHVKFIRPEALQKYLINKTTYPSTIVMNNISLAALDDDTIDKLINAVKLNGVGLVVLGGNHAFSNGGYRKSRLESILPLISESGRPDSDIAIDFVIDKSGSMSSPVGTTTRFDIIKDSIIYTLPTFNNYDKIGIVTFDNQAKILLRPTRHFRNIVRHLFKNIIPGGGSNLYPALQLAISNLLAVHAHKRAIVILTDGFVVHSDYRKIKTLLKHNRINIVVLAIGKNTNNAFMHQLSAEYGATIINVTNPIHLFKTLDMTLQKYRDSIVYKNTPILSVKTLPFEDMAGTHPDMIKYYNVTKKETSAELYMQTPTGDPLLAARTVGLGNTVAFASGSDQIGSHFLQGLISMVDPRERNPFMNIRLNQVKKWLSITINVLSHRNADWDNIHTPKAFVRLPDNEIKPVSLKKVLPGEFKSRLPTNQTGLYKISISHEGGNIQKEIYVNNFIRIHKEKNHNALYKKLVNSNLAGPYSAKALARNLSPTIEVIHLRYLLSITSLFIYLLIITHENNLWELDPQKIAIKLSSIIRIRNKI